MILRNPYTGKTVDAPEDVGRKLAQRGFEPVAKAAQKRATSKRPPKRD